MAHGHGHDHVGHHHGHDHGHDHGTGEGARRIAFAFWLNLGFTVFEIVGGILTNSVAIVSDALHDLGDSLSLGLAWYFQRLGQRGRDKDYSYGYRRFSVLGALINTLVLVAGSVFLLFRAVPRLLEPEPVQSEGMILLAVVGVLVNGIAARRLMGGGGLNERVVSLHLLEDVLGWVAVLIGSILMYFWELPWIDPLLSLLITAYILYNAVLNLRAALQILLQRTPKGIDLEEVHGSIVKIPGVMGAHGLRAWSLDGRYMVMTLHAQVSAERTMGEVEAIKLALHEEMKSLGIDHVTVEFETPEADCEEK